MSVVKIYIKKFKVIGNRGGLTVSALYSGSRGSGSRLGWVTMLCFLCFFWPLSQPTVWVLANCLGSGRKSWRRGLTGNEITSHPGNWGKLRLGSITKFTRQLPLF